MDRRRLALAALAPLPVVAAASLAIGALAGVPARLVAIACSIPGALLAFIALSLYELTVDGGRPGIVARVAARNNTRIDEDDTDAVVLLALTGVATLAWSLLLAFAPY